jgi:uracil-DNA glycosylase
VRRVEIEATFQSWQTAARSLLREHVAPDEIVWVEATPLQETLPGVVPGAGTAAGSQAEPAGIAGDECIESAISANNASIELASTVAGSSRESSPVAIRVPRAFIDLARRVASHRDPARWSLLYEVLWRLVRENRDLLKTEADPQVTRLTTMARDVGGVTEKTGVADRASGGRLRGAATLDPATGAARLRRAGSDTAPRSIAPHRGRRVEEAVAGRPESGRPELSKPEAAPQEAMSAAPFVPTGAGLEQLRAAAARCTGCDLYRHATQTVFGRGPLQARIVLVGEQPGDQEDRQGAPFVGPAGEILDRALADVGLQRDDLYVTNAVKHFKFVDTGKRRIHQTPRPAEVAACRPWMEAELAAINPAVVVCLGATAARALLGADFRLLKERGRFFTTRWAPKTIATLHPSAVLRGEDEASQARLYGMLVEDLRLVAEAA